jgi:signal transduction histidine kinase
LLLFEDYDGVMIRLKGRLVSVENVRDNSPRLVMDAEGVAVVAQFVTGGTSSDLARLLPGSEVEVTGICSLTLAEHWPRSLLPVPERFSVLLQSPDAVRVIRQPPWWTATRLKNALLAMSVLLAFSVAAVVFLRRAVARRSAQLAGEMRARQEQESALHDAEVGFKATLAERERMAADLHDTLEQALTGVAMQLEAIKTAPSSDLAARNLNLAGQMLAVSREDVRRSVWNLRTQALDGRSFLGALERVANTFLDHTPIGFSLEATGKERRISDFIASNLLILAKEALTNSIKHSKATNIVVSVGFGREAITLVFRDNGCGFAQDEVPGPHEGHFGLTGMRERVARLSGRFSIESRPGAGTTITVFVPAGKDEDPVAANGPELLATAAENDA